jgi:8-oxo-dGTP diphosphatase
MITFYDVYHNLVSLSFEDHPFSNQPKHVLVICRYNRKWLLTKHADRGLEFPGGKVEANETAEDAAKREVMEETGGVVSQLHYIGQYMVKGKEKTIIKNIYFAHIEKLLPKQTYFETEGPVLLETLPKDLTVDSRFSFIMKDGVVKYSLDKIKQLI